MKKVMIYAYTSSNLGDDLFIKELCERYPNTKFQLYAHSDYKKKFYNNKNLNIISNNNLFNRLINFCSRKFKFINSIQKYKTKKCDAVIYIGGSIFMQKNNWEKKYERMNSVLNFKKPVYIIGANFGPYEDKDFVQKHNNLFKKVTDVCFRDKYSYQLFETNENVRLANDVIFQMEVNHSSNEKKEDYIVISVIKPSIRQHLSNYDELYYKKIKELIIYFTNQNLKVVLISFCEREGDEEAISEIMNKLPMNTQENVSRHHYRQNIDSALEVIANSKLIIATRFHAMILGWIYNKPVLPIAYSSKMTNVIEDIGFEGFYTDFKSLANLDVESTFDKMKFNSIDISIQKDNAVKQFKKLDEYLLQKKR